MKVLKFGGGCLKDAESIKKLPKILSKFSNETIFIVVSAFGKMTNMLEQHNFEAVFSFVNQIMEELNFNSADIESVLNRQNKHLQSSKKSSYTYRVSLGEYLSSLIIQKYLHNYKNIYTNELNAADYVFTESWNSELKSAVLYTTAFSIYSQDDDFLVNIYQKLTPYKTLVTQGFIASEFQSREITTLGREGSDYSAAIFGAALNAVDAVILFKDVDGVYNKDPKKYPDAELFSHLTYDDAFKLCSNGNTVVHPKTINHLKQKKIPLVIKNFDDLSKPGTVIS